MKDLKDAIAEVVKYGLAHSVAQAFLIFSGALVIASVWQANNYIPVSFFTLFYALINFKLEALRRHESLGEYAVGGNRLQIALFTLIFGFLFVWWATGVWTLLHNLDWQGWSCPIFASSPCTSFYALIISLGLIVMWLGNMFRRIPKEQKPVDSKIEEAKNKTEVKDKQEENTKKPAKRIIYNFLRLALILFFIFGGSAFLTEKLTPSDYTIRFKRECDGIKCEKIKIVDSERSTTIENDIGALSTTLERIDFFARFTFLRFDFQITNKSQFIFVVTEPKYEKGVDIIMQCNLNEQNYVFSPNSGIIFKQKSSLGNIIKELGKVQDVLINCNPAPQDIRIVPTEQIVVAPNAQVQFIYNEEKYNLRFLPDKWNYPLTVLQIFIITGIFLGAYYEIMRFIKRGLKEYRN